MKLLLLLLLCIAALSTTSNAQWLQYDKAFDPKDSNDVRSFAKSIQILQTGEVIAGFQRGIFHLDNGLWRKYTLDTTEFMRGGIINMLKDSLDNLWIATGYGLKYYDTKLRKITQHYLGRLWAYDSSAQPSTSYYHEIEGLAIDSSGGIWVAGMSNAAGISHFKDGKWTKYTILSEKEFPIYGIAASGGTSFEVEKNGCLWYTAFEGVVRYDPKTNSRTLFDTLRIGNDVISLKYAGRIQITRDGKIWLNAQLDYIISFNPQDSTWKVYYKKDIPNVRPEDAGLTLFRKCAAEDAKGNLWMTFRRDYLAKYDTTTKKWKKMQLPPGRDYDKGTITLLEYGLAVDGKGQVWVGTLAEGVVVYTGEANDVQETNAVEGLAHTWIFSITPNPVAGRSRVQVFADPTYRSSLQVGLYSLLGSEVRDLTPKAHIDWATGHGTIEVEAEDIPNGVYLLRVSNGADNYVSLMPVVR